MICAWCKLPTQDTQDVAYPRLNCVPPVKAEHPDFGGAAVYHFHAVCWDMIRRLKVAK